MRAADARPCTTAERAPAAMIVENDMPSAPFERASYSMAAATSTSRTPGRIFAHAIRNKLAPSSIALRISRISPASFTMRARSTSGGAERTRAFPRSNHARRSRAPAVSDSGSIPSTSSGAPDLLRRAANHSAAATTGDLFQSRCARLLPLPSPGQCSGRR